MTSDKARAALIFSANLVLLVTLRPALAGDASSWDGTELAYQSSQRHAPDTAAGVRWDDPAFGIDWPATPAVISVRDASYGDVQESL